MICHDKRIVFVHLRRTAGNSLEVALGGIELFDESGLRTFAWDNRLHRGKTPFKKDLRGHPIHATAAEIRSLYPQIYDRYFRFSIVRNPWAQMASLYARLFSADVAMIGFRRWLCRCRHHAGTVPQASLFDRHGRCLVDFVGRFESLQQDFDAVCDRVGMPRQPLPCTNQGGGASCRPELSALYDAASIRLVRNLYAADIERFGYEFPTISAAAG